MLHLVSRTARFWRRLGLLLAVALLVTVSVRSFLPDGWSGRPDLHLVALGPAGQFRSTVELPRQWADTSFRGAYGATARIPLVLAMRNDGEAAARPTRLDLSVPARFRLVGPDGKELPHQTVPGNPLVRYLLDGPFPTLEPGRLPTVVSNPDTLWIEPILPSLYCVALGDSVPDFVPATPAHPSTLSDLRVFYSFDGEDLPGRQAGLLEIRLDSTLLRQPPTRPPVLYDATTMEPQQPLPPVGELRFAGMNTARCGEPEAPMEITSYVWRTEDGGRLLDLYVGGKARKYLFDLNQDSTVELEMWDPDADGRFEVKRPVRYAIPAFLLPPPGPPPFDPAVFAALPQDSLARLDVFQAAGTFRQTVPPPDTAAAERDRFRVGTAGRRAYVPFTPAPAAPPPEQPAAPRVRDLPPPPGVHLLGKPVKPNSAPPPR